MYANGRDTISLSLMQKNRIECCSQTGEGDNDTVLPTKFHYYYYYIIAM